MATQTSTTSRGPSSKVWAMASLLALLATVSTCATLGNSVSFDAAPIVVSLHFNS